MAALLFGPRGTLHTIGVIAIFSLPSIRNWGSTPYGNLILARLGVVSLLAITTAILVSRERNARLKVHDLNVKMKEIVKEKDKFFTLASEAQENERRRISRDLHDDSLQLLASVMHKLDDAINAQNLDDARAQMLRAKETITQTSDAIRRYCEELRPMLLDSLGLAPSVEWMGRELELSSGIKVDFETRGETREIRAKDLIHIYRVMQESFHNIERHSKATAARVVWNFTQEDLEISVTDNGIGMWNFGPAPARSLGIQGMHERMELIGGKLTIESQPGFGTKISLRVPFEEPIT